MPGEGPEGEAERRGRGELSGKGAERGKGGGGDLCCFWSSSSEEAGSGRCCFSGCSRFRCRVSAAPRVPRNRRSASRNTERRRCCCCSRGDRDPRPPVRPAAAPGAAGARGPALGSSGELQPFRLKAERNLYLYGRGEGILAFQWELASCNLKKEKKGNIFLNDFEPPTPTPKNQKIEQKRKKLFLSPSLLSTECRSTSPCR